MLYDIGASSPSLVILKHEVQKVEKLQRIIESVSMTDYVVEQLVCGDLYRDVKSACLTDYSAIGISFSLSDADLLHKRFAGFETSSSDVPKFDMTVTEEEMQNHAYYLALRHGGSAIAHRIHSNLEYSYSRRFLLLSDGALLKQEHYGGQASGRLGTSCCNTFIRACRSQAVNIMLGTPHHPHVSAGDDNVETFNPLKPDIYRDLGFPLRDYEKTVGPISFCSHDWVPDQKPIAQRVFKCLAAVLWNDADGLSDNFDSFVQVFYKHPQFRTCLRLLFHTRWKQICNARSLAARSIELPIQSPLSSGRNAPQIQQAPTEEAQALPTSS